MHQHLDELQQSIRSLEAASTAGDVLAERDIAGRLAASLESLSQTSSPSEDFGAAAGPAGLFRQIALGRDASGRIQPGQTDASLLQQAIKETSSSVDEWRSREIRAELDRQRESSQVNNDFQRVEWALALTPIFIITAVLCASVIRRDARRQTSDRERMEDELRRAHNTLEKRIESRTAQLQNEVAERQRAEQLNRGRNELLEMLAQEEPAQKIFQSLTDVIAKDRSRWCCALHLVRNGELYMESSSGLPSSLLRNLKQLNVNMADAPEAIALRERKQQVIEDLPRERKPWPQLLFASGIQSLWSMPIFAPDTTPLGTLTIYSLLQCQPTQHDWELLESHSKMAALVLERYRLQQDLRRHAYHDSLTGLPNRLLGEEQLTSAIRRGSRLGTAVAVLWIDLNKFKQTNDVHGHIAGDAVLKEVAMRLSGRLRESDTIARMGGDEFMAVLEGVADRAAAERVAESLLASLTAPIPFQQLMLPASASIGVSMYPEDGDSADLLERNADMAMYEAKFGHHGVRAFSPALDSVLSERRELAKAMVEALDTNGFVLHYQPQYGMRGKLAGFEALLRLPHPVMGMVSPARLIPIAEESEMIISLGKWVLREACEQSLRWQAMGYRPIPIAVNISAMQFVRQDFADQVAEVLNETGLDPELLELELTESVMVKDFVESTKQLQRLKGLGVSIAVDDFGTGYSSLNQLHRLPIDRLKIDRSFIQALNEPRGTLPIVESIIAMAHRMDMLVVAEGVETKQQMQTLCGHDCDLLQGYLYSVPVNADYAATLMQSEGLMSPYNEVALIPAAC
jgi:diguanylate cyclase (GGDEF)-like protein